MTTRLFEPSAETDLNEIIDFLSGHAGTAVALKYATAFQRAFDRIRDFPAGGSPRPFFGADTRVVIVQPYLIFYDYMIETDTVHVLRILHPRRNITLGLVRS